MNNKEVLVEFQYCMIWGGELMKGRVEYCLIVIMLIPVALAIAAG